MFTPVTGKQVKVGNDQEMAHSERNSYSKNRGGKRTKSKIIRRKHIVSRRKTYRKQSEGIHCQQFLLHSQILNNLISFFSGS